MQASQFRFSLSKQRIDYACLVVNTVDAKSLVNIWMPVHLMLLGIGSLLIVAIV
jgi:hypothetical protein